MANIFQRLLLALAFLAVFLVGALIGPSTAAAETRSLKIYFVHTGEKQEIVYKRNGRFDPKGLQQLNTILRDWRRNEATKMDPHLFDLVWSVYQKAGGSGYIYVVSGYRSPATNSLLRSRSKGVAKESQHMRGTAMDFFVPGVSLKSLRDIGMKMQAGGVGYYPNSGSPFVHMDVAGVRSWPRMPRDELARLFPDGKTLHIPADGRPMPGYDLALADYKRRLGSDTIMMADSKTPSRNRPRNLMAMLFGGGDEDEGDEDAAPARPTRAPPAATQQPVMTNADEGVAVAAATPPPSNSAPQIDVPVPQSRPSFRPGDGSLATALYSPTNHNAAEDALQRVAANAPGQGGAPVDPEQAADRSAYEDLAAYKIPVPTLLGPRGMKGDAEQVLTASVAPGSLPPVQNGALNIPVPAGRPALADAVAATVPQQRPQSMGEPSTVEEAMLTPAAADALDRSRADSDMAPTLVALPQDRPAAQIVKPTAPPRPSRQVAALQPAGPRSTGNFGDVFDQPAPNPSAADPAASRATPAKVVRGGRPGPSEAEAANRGVQDPKLTKAAIAQWAASSGLGTTGTEPAVKSGKSSRVVANAAPGPVPVAPAPAASSFTLPPKAIDPGRFGAVR